MSRGYKMIIGVMEHLEKEGERKVAALMHAGAQTEGAQTEGAQTEGAQTEGAQALMAIINEGNDAFKREHGRNMSYAEMREMYG